MTDHYENIRKALEMGPPIGPFSSVRSYSPGNQELIIRLTCNDEYGITENYCTVRNSLGDTGKTEASAAFIAACDPDTIRALLAERDELVEAPRRPAAGRCGMKRLHVAVSPLTNRIFTGSVLKDGQTWAANKTDVTGEACAAVAMHVMECGTPVVVAENGVPRWEITVRELQQGGCTDGLR